MLVGIRFQYAARAVAGEHKTSRSVTPGTLDVKLAVVKEAVAHPTDERLQALYLGKLKTVDSVRLQRHLFRCGPCLERLIRFEFLLAVSDVAGGGPRSPEYDHRKPLFIRHDTADGFRIFAGGT